MRNKQELRLRVALPDVRSEREFTPSLHQNKTHKPHFSSTEKQTQFDFILFFIFFWGILRFVKYFGFVWFVNR